LDIIVLVNPSRYTATSSGLGGSSNFPALCDGYVSDGYISDFFADLRTAFGTSLGTSFAGFFADFVALAFLGFGGTGIVPSGYYIGNVVAFFALTFISFGGAGSICICIFICLILSDVINYLNIFVILFVIN
jgi:hypothetical protein